MNDEEAFQAALDAHPDDHTTRLVFADWLEERGDLRAEGYRALGRMRVRPKSFPHDDELWAYHNGEGTGGFEGTGGAHVLPQEWLNLTQDVEHERAGRDARAATAHTVLSSCLVGPRRAVEVAAALAFARLPARRRGELLAATGPKS